ncbi:hypothetical protein JW960_15785 [candidate division KSB1 bacterium]|nr:hypothetical protein [candidate division KSB1 bacterium]
MTRVRMTVASILIMATTVCAQSGYIGMTGTATPVKTEKNTRYTQAEYGIVAAREVNFLTPMIVSIMFSYGEQQFAYGMQLIGDKQMLELNNIGLNSWSITVPLLGNWHVNQWLQFNAGVGIRFTSLMLHQGMSYAEETEPITINGEIIAGSELSNDLERSATTRSVTALPMAEMIVELPLHMNFVFGSAWQPSTSVSLASDSFATESGFHTTLPTITHSMQGFHFFSGMVYRF